MSLPLPSFLQAATDPKEMIDSPCPGQLVGRNPTNMVLAIDLSLSILWFLQSTKISHNAKA